MQEKLRLIAPFFFLRRQTVSPILSDKNALFSPGVIVSVRRVIGEKGGCVGLDEREYPFSGKCGEWRRRGKKECQWAELMYDMSSRGRVS